METIVGLQLINPMEMIMVTEFFVRLLSAFARNRARSCAHTMLRLDNHLLRDIGLTQTDVEHCMATPSQMTDGCMPARRSQNLETAAAVAECEAKAQASPPADGLAA
jgi:uncharacterized protein YjiS (DUF1127 family)